MNDLMMAYQRDEIKNFEQILKQNQEKIMEDTFIRNYIQDLLKNIRTQVRACVLAMCPEWPLGLRSFYLFSERRAP